MGLSNVTHIREQEKEEEKKRTLHSLTHIVWEEVEIKGVMRKEVNLKMSCVVHK